MAEPAEDGEPQPKKKSAMVMTIVAVAVLTVIGGGGGWFLGGMLSAQLQPAKEEAKKPAAEHAAPEGEHAAKEEEGLAQISTEANGVVQLAAITTNLAFPTDRLVRLEVALLFKDKPDIKLAEAIHQDIAVYLRTVSLQQIEGPRGFQYLKEDLEERADLLSQGKVSHIMFRTFLIQ